MKLMIKLMTIIFVTYFSGATFADSNISRSHIATTVNKYIKPLMRKYQIPGIAVAITLDDKTYFFNYGVSFPVNPKDQ